MRGFRNLLGALALGAAAALNPLPARAAGEAIHIPDTRFSFDGLFGTFDRGSLQRGFQVYKEVCSACHAMRQLSYRNLLDLGRCSNARPASPIASAAPSRMSRRRGRPITAPIRPTSR